MEQTLRALVSLAVKNNLKDQGSRSQVTRARSIGHVKARTKMSPIRKNFFPQASALHAALSNNDLERMTNNELASVNPWLRTNKLGQNVASN